MKFGFRVLLWAALVALAAVVGHMAWQHFQPKRLPSGFASGNGRIEAVEIDVATKIAGRIEEIFVDEGDFVSERQLLAKMDT
ncbi:MAG: biotin/lipoyl-binding protein, partial [Methylocystis silviterrae]